MDFTGERYLPNLDSPEISYEHWHRYLYATQFVEDKVVLDIACGEGYGSDLLAKTARKVVGVDIDKKTIGHAKNTYKKANLEFLEGSVAEIPVKGKAFFDVIVSFETIEHVEKDKQKKFLDEIKRLLKESGVLIISTPNKLTYSDVSGFKNEFHVKEFYLDEYLKFLKQYFRNVKILGQKIYASSNIWNPENEGNKFNEFILEYTKSGFRPSNNSKNLSYVIALCSSKILPVSESSILTDLSNKMFVMKDEYAKSLKDIVEEKDVYTESLQKAIKEKDEYAKSLQKETEKKDEYGKSLQEIVIAKDEDVESLRKTVEKGDVIIKLLKNTVEEKEKYILWLTDVIENKDIEIKNIKTELIIRENTIGTIQSELVELRKDFVLFQAKLEDLWKHYLDLKKNHEYIINSLSWKFTKPFRIIASIPIKIWYLLKMSFLSIKREGIKIFLIRVYNYLLYGSGYNSIIELKKIEGWIKKQREIIDNDKFKNAMILFRPHGLGDLIMGLSSFYKLREKYQNKPLILVTFSEFVEFIDKFCIFDYVMGLPPKFNYELYINKIPVPDGGIFINMMTELVKDKNGYNNLNNDFNKVHRDDVFSKVLSVDSKYKNIKCPVYKNAQINIDKKLNWKKIKKKIVVIGFEASNPSRTWDESKYLSLIKKIHDLGYLVIVTGLKKNQMFDVDYCLNWTGDLKNVTELIELIRRAKYVISTDTALYHIAGLLGKPFLVIFTGGIVPNSRLKYYSKFEYVVSSRGCFCWDMPCNMKNNFTEIEPCRKDISVNMVIDKFKKLIKNY